MALNDIGGATNIEFDKGSNITETDQRKHFAPDPQGTKITSQKIEYDRWNGFFREIPELQAVVDRLGTWVIYGGDDSDPKAEDITFKTPADEKRFKSFVGYGKDTPKGILYNLFRQGKICGNTVGEIIRGKKKGVINLKPLDPGTITVNANEKGFLKPFTHTPKGTEPGAEKEIPLERLFFIPWNRMADEIVGISTVEKLQTIIDYRHQAMEDLALVYHRYVVPFWVFYSDTDDDTEIATFNGKIKNFIQQRDHITIPYDTIKKHERMSVPQFSTLDPLNWIKHLERYFLLSEGVPEIISGIGRETADASSRMIYLSWRMIVIANQKIFEDNIEIQLGIKLKLPRPINILAPEITEEKAKIIPARKNDPANPKEKKNG